MSTPIPSITVGIPVTFQGIGNPKRGTGIAIWDSIDGIVLVAVSSFYGEASIAPNNGLVNMPVQSLAKVAQTPQQAADNWCKGVLLRTLYAREGMLSNQPYPTTDAQRAQIQAYIAAHGSPTAP